MAVRPCHDSAIWPAWRSIELDASLLDELRPAADFELQVIAEIFRAATQRRYAESVKPLAHIRLLKYAHDLGVEAVDDRAWRARRRENVVPRDHREAGYAGLRNRWNLRRNLGAFRAA